VHVESRGGVVTLTGTVESNDAKAALENLVKTTSGVKSLASSVTAPQQNDDCAVVSEIQNQLASDPVLGNQAIKADCSAGVVRLSGTVDTDEQKARAEQVARRVNGAVSVVNQINVAPAPPPPPNVPPPPPTVTLTADPQMVVLPSAPKTTLRWTAENATEVDLKSRVVVDGQETEIGKLDFHTTRIDEYPTKDTEYTATAKGPGGTKSVTVVVKVWNAEVRKPPTATLAGPAQPIHPGEPATLTYTSSGATSLNLDPGGPLALPSGSVRVSPPKTQTYTLTATGPGGSITTDPVTVTVTPPPPPPPCTGPIAVRLDASVDTSSKKGQMLRATVLSAVRGDNCEIPADAPARVVLLDIKKVPLEHSEAKLQLLGLTVGGSESTVNCDPFTKTGPRVINPKAVITIIQPGTQITFQLRPVVTVKP
jgi:hypothetical protein